MLAVEPDRVEPARWSPGLDQFRKSPFRALRLAPSATPQQALWQGEKILARVRSGVAVPEPDPIPWLAPATELEIMDAMQTIESPLARVVEQLLWFDFEADPRGAELRDALVAQDPERLHACLMASSDGPLAARYTQVNLRLLIAFSELRGVGPRVLASAAGEPPSWTRDGALEVIDDAHAVVRARAGRGGSWSTLLGDALLAWGRLLKYPDVIEDVRARLAMLGLLDGEHVSEDDAEAVSKAVWTRLADLIIGEARLELQRGAIENAVRLTEVARGSEIDPEIWLAASRPLRTQFQAELAALEPGARTGGGALADVTAYLDRLTALVARWRSLDPKNQLGLASQIDDAVGDVLGRLRGIEGKPRGLPAFRGQVERIAELATARSLRQRIKAFLDEVRQAPFPAEVLATATCHFCRSRPGVANHAAVLVMRRWGSHFGDATGAQPWPVARCAACAARHRRIFGLGQLALWSCFVAGALFALLVPMSAAATLLALAAALAGALVARAVVRGRGARSLTPAGHRRYDDHAEAEAHAVALDSGVRGDMAYDETDGAWQRADVYRENGMYVHRSIVAIANALGWTLASVIFGAMYVVAWVMRSLPLVLLIGGGVAVLVLLAKVGDGRLLLFVVVVAIKVAILVARSR